MEQNRQYDIFISYRRLDEQETLADATKHV